MIKEKIKKCFGFDGEVVVLCIGSDRITGDCLGPLVGQLLVCHYNIPAFVYGTLENPVNALNLKEVLSSIKRWHKGCKIIAVDSCVGGERDVGSIRATSGYLRPGSADGKNLPRVGNFSITAVTSDQPPTSFAFASVRLGFVYKLSGMIAKGINLFFAEKQEIYSNKRTVV